MSGSSGWENKGIPASTINYSPSPAPNKVTANTAHSLSQERQRERERKREREKEGERGESEGRIWGERVIDPECEIEIERQKEEI